MQSQGRAARAILPGRWAAIAAILVGCAQGAPAPPAALPGARPTAGPPTAVASAAEAPPLPWDLGAELSRMRRTAARAPSEHLTGEADAEVLCNDAARPYPALGPSPQIAPGATVVERIFARGSESITAYFAMVKRPAGYAPDDGDWEYLVIGADQKVEERGHLGLCARCHADAPHDHLFGTGR